MRHDSFTFPSQIVYARTAVPPNRPGSRPSEPATFGCVFHVKHTWTVTCRNAPALGRKLQTAAAAPLQARRIARRRLESAVRAIPVWGMFHVKHCAAGSLGCMAGLLAEKMNFIRYSTLVY